MRRAEIMRRQRRFRQRFLCAGGVNIQTRQILRHTVAVVAGRNIAGDRQSSTTTAPDAPPVQAFVPGGQPTPASSGAVASVSAMFIAQRTQTGFQTRGVSTSPCISLPGAL